MADPVFALHGWGLNAAVFAGLESCLVEREFIPADLPGHGRRAGESLGRDPDSLVKRLLDAAPGRAVWLGWSLGGTLALAAALAAPERISALIVVAATPAFVARPNWPHGMPGVRLEKMAWELARDPEQTVKDFLALQVRASAAGRAALGKLRKALIARGPTNTRALADGLVLLEKMDYRGALDRIEQPTLVVAGGRDRLVQPAAARALVKALPNARLVLMEEAAHAPFLSHTEQFCREAKDFLAELPDADA
jgi:pimeloyl-[acyl-carrier protein] methyl ester esterase